MQYDSDEIEQNTLLVSVATLDYNVLPPMTTFYAPCDSEEARVIVNTCSKNSDGEDS